MTDSVIDLSVIDMDERAKQVPFSRLVGVSQPAVAKMVDKNVLKRGGTYREWLLAYCDRIRESAAQWGAGDDDDALRAAKIRESNANASLKELQAAEKAKELARIEDLKYKFGVALDHMRSVLVNSDSKMRDMVKRDHEIDLPKGYFKTVGRDALSEISKFVRPAEDLS